MNSENLQRNTNQLLEEKTYSPIQYKQDTQEMIAKNNTIIPMAGIVIIKINTPIVSITNLLYINIETKYSNNSTIMY